MIYFQCQTRMRQTILLLSVFLVLSIPAQTFAQQDNGETSKQNKPTEIQPTIQPAEKTVAPQLTVDRPRLLTTVADFAAENPSASSQLNERFRDSSFDFKPEVNRRQQSGGDDTMMGVMGKGTDGIKLGGHVGFVVPIVGRGGGVTTNLGDRFVFGFPVGLTVKTKNNVAIDFEFIPTFNTGRDFVFTIHPGIIYGFKKKYAVGVRAAYDAGAASFGFTPLISRGFKINEKLGWFIEADFPIRSNYRPYGDRFGSIAFAAHTGIAF